MTLTTARITRIDRRGGRHYQVEGHDEPFPSVTTVLNVIAKPALIPWARNVALEKVKETLYEHLESGSPVIDSLWVDTIIEQARHRPDQVRDAAADFGTQAHVLLEQHIQGLEPEIPPEFVQVLDNFTTWRRRERLDIHLAETMVYSAKYRYAGTMDALAYRGDLLVALDWKTSNGLYPEYALQVAAYAKAMEEMGGKPVSEAWVVRLGKREPDFEPRKVVDLDAAFNAFRAALFLWRSMQGATGWHFESQRRGRA